MDPEQKLQKPHYNPVIALAHDFLFEETIKMAQKPKECSYLVSNQLKKIRLRYCFLLQKLKARSSADENQHFSSHCSI